ncbi:MAG: T9SS type A sorting domain-containing protein [Crocinitomicaceae bacterium]|nr:T9SS type A sorting domain-containing protein [Crocinitomicaceae bacterium]
MKKITLFLVGIFLLSLNSSLAQKCGTDNYTMQKMQELGLSELDMHERIMRIVEHQPSGSRVGPYTIPVVFHVIHDNGLGNISQVQIQDALDALNEDYNKLNADSVNWRNTASAPFEPRVADIQVTFKLAKLDPNGNCTNGIVRVNAPHLTYNATDDVKSAANGGSDAWNVSMYMNVWVVNSIDGSGQGTTLGYATLPYFGVSNTSGIVVRHDAVGRQGVGTANSDGRTLTHEGGHFLGLLHTFQAPFFGGTSGCHTTDCNNSGDYICDTPPTDVATFTCNYNLNTCTGVPANSYYGIDVNDMIENYMSYDVCTNMFSEGQKSRIWSVLDSTAFPEYNNLVSASNATATGINLPDVLCTADFASDARIICAGETINFTDESFNYVTSRTWSFPGGTPSSLTDSAVSVVYATPGIYDVSISVTDGSSTRDTTRTGYIIVLDNPGNKDTLADSFESYSSFPDYDNWVVQTGYSQSFEVTNTASVSGLYSLVLPIHGQTGIRTDELVSGVYDFSSASLDSNFYINFKYAYKNRTSNTSNGTNFIKIYISQDCGETWLARKNIIGSSFGNGVDSNPFVPTSGDWISEELMLPVSQVQYSNFRFKFVIGTEEANNVYLEDINVYIAGQSHLAVDNLESNFDFAMYPNPAKKELNIGLNIKSPQVVNVDLLDLSGRKIKVLLENQKLHPGEQSKLSLDGVSSGVYLVQMNINGQQIVRKLVIE